MSVIWQVIMPIVIAMCVIMMRDNSECHYAEWYYAEWHYADWHNDERHIFKSVCLMSL
jgi:hypothetical protein